AALGAPAWAWPSSSTWPRSTGAASGSTTGPAAAPSSGSTCPSPGTCPTLPESKEGGGVFVEALGRALLTLLLVLALASQAAAAPALAGAATLDAGALGLRVRAQQRPVEAFFGPGGLYLPARNLLSALGYDVSFNQAHGTVTAAG